MTELLSIFAHGPQELSIAGIFLAWTFAFGVSALVLTPDLFLRGRDPELISDRTRAYAWFYHRLTGGLLMGGTAWLGVRLAGGDAARFGFVFGRFDRSVIVVALVLMVAVPAVIRRSRWPDFRDRHPEIRIRRWTGRLLSNNRTTWLVYLGGYEALLRGFTLFALVDVVGSLPALAITVCLDVAAHLRRPPVEAAAVLPVSLAFSVGALWTGSMIGPWLARSVIVMTAETLARPAAPPARDLGGP